MSTPRLTAADKKIHAIRHSLSHLLATAVLEKFPGTKLGIGPVIENGFYYDFDFAKGEKITEQDFPELEAKMKKLIREEIAFKKFQADGRKVAGLEKKISKLKGTKSAKSKALELKKLSPGEKELVEYIKRVESNSGPGKYKKELLLDLIKEGKNVSVYQSGEFTDLCAGPHVKNTKEIPLDAFKLTTLAGAYWKGSEKNKMLTRIYGVAFSSKNELDEYLKNEEEAKRRDHRKLGKELGIFAFDDMVGKGLPLWLPNGTIVKNEIERLAVELEEKYGYLRVSTPHVAKQDLYLTSGHLPHYADSMYPKMVMDDGVYYLKAMNCPHHHMIYKSEPRSYKDLPYRLAEYGTCYRNELSGTLAGLLRVRSLQMNDAHIYCTKDQIESEFERVIALTLEHFKIFGLSDYWFRLSKWGPKNKSKYINEPKNWTYTEGVLRAILKKTGVRFIEVSDEAAFYGPKVDFQFKSVIGREETMSTIQLDFAAKKRFNLTYKDANGKDNNEVFVIHRAPLSTHERFMAFLLEHYAGAFPTWLSPVQTAVIPVSDKHGNYAHAIAALLKAKNVRVKVLETNDTLGKRIREAEMKKIPYALVVGDKEKENETVSVRSYHRGQLGEMKNGDFVETIAKEITERKAS